MLCVTKEKKIVSDAKNLSSSSLQKITQQVGYMKGVVQVPKQADAHRDLNSSDAIYVQNPPAGYFHPSVHPFVHPFVHPSIHIHHHLIPSIHQSNSCYPLRDSSKTS